ncbi:lanthionine synthetase C family protein [Kitasatospora sp. NPDC092286]|uniref:lanthionine synthetase C family protein n=1 Tax=Kitasatospora sp. NPDC092286 TaxID=3364087 RepID=UPI0037F3E79F
MNTQRPSSAAEAADLLTARLTALEPPPPDEPWRAHSLAEGATGTALLHIERARAGHGSWPLAHTWVTAAAGSAVSAADNTGLFLGLPAVAFLLDAAAGESGRYRDARATLDRHLADLAHRRVRTAMDRIRSGRPAIFHEYDTFFGLTGIGACLLRTDPGGSALEQVLRYLIALTRPLLISGQRVPGWWVSHDPRRRPHPAGHANVGAAHGITGPLMLLGQAARHGIAVDGQYEAIAAICSWLDTWRQDNGAGPWWPEHLTLEALRTGRPDHPGPGRPGWCYGTPGIARAGQIAAIALAEPARQRAYEDAFHQCLSDPAQTVRLTGAGLCHGWAGVYQSAWRTAQDATTTELATRLPSLAEILLRHAISGTRRVPGFLDGDAGTALALTTAARNAAPISGWDACLLIT